MKLPLRKLLLSLALLGPSLPAAAANLADVLAAADGNDPQWKATMASFIGQQEVLAQGRSGILPTIVLTGDKVENTLESPSGTIDYDTTTLAIQATQPLLRADRWFQYQAARASRSRVDAEFVSAEQDYLIRVTETYLSVLRAAEQLAYARAEETAFSRQLEQARQRFNVGLTAITEVHETQAVYDLTRVGLIIAETELAVARTRLETLTGQRYGSLAFPGEDMPIALPEPAGANAWAEKARGSNARLIAARHAARAAHQNARAATSGHFPNIDLYARRVENDGPASLSTPVVTNIDTTNDAIGLQLQWPLFAGGAINSRRKQAGHENIAAQESLRAAELNAAEGARTQYRILEADVLRVAARKQAIVSAQSALDATQAGYDVGTRNIVDLLQAQRNAFAARRDLANARYDYILDLLRLNAAAGALSREAIIASNQWLNVTIDLDDGSAQPVPANNP